MLRHIFFWGADFRLIRAWLTFFFQSTSSWGLLTSAYRAVVYPGLPRMGLFLEAQGCERSEPPWVEFVVDLPTRYGLFQSRIAERNDPFRQRCGAIFIEKTGTNQKDVCHCMTVPGQCSSATLSQRANARLFSVSLCLCGSVVQCSSATFFQRTDTASEKTPMQLHVRLVPLVRETSNCWRFERCLYSSLFASSTDRNAF